MLIKRLSEERRIAAKQREGGYSPSSQPPAQSSGRLIPSVPPTTLSGSEPLQVLIASRHRLLAEGLQRLLAQGPPAVRCRVVTDLEAAEALAARPPDVLVFAPAGWEEMLASLPDLEQRSGACPWLIVADWLVAGLFLSSLERHPGTIVGSHAAPEELRTALTALAAGEALFPPEMLLTRFEAGAARPPYRRAGLRAKAWQVETCCGVGLGLSNEQLGRACHVSAGTARNRVSGVESWLAMGNREEAGRLVRHALTP